MAYGSSRSKACLTHLHFCNLLPFYWCWSKCKNFLKNYHTIYDTFSVIDCKSVFQVLNISKKMQFLITLALLRIYLTYLRLRNNTNNNEGISCTNHNKGIASYSDNCTLIFTHLNCQKSVTSSVEVCIFFTVVSTPNIIL